MTTTNDSITRLERKAWMLLAIAAIPTTLSAYLMLRKPPDPEWPSIIDHVLLENGISAFARPTRTHLTFANLHAEGTGATLGFGVEEARVFQLMTNGRSIFSWTADGRVDSEVSIDTATGEWTIVRSYRDASGVAQNDERQLLAPLSE